MGVRLARNYGSTSYTGREIKIASYSFQFLYLGKGGEVTEKGVWVCWSSFGNTLSDVSLFLQILHLQWLQDAGVNWASGSSFIEH